MDKQLWLEQIEKEFDNQTPEQITFLLNRCKSTLDDEMCLSIVKTIEESKVITFKQWKALRAETSKKNIRYKKL
jgi:hypothetical protein